MAAPDRRRTALKVRYHLDVHFRNARPPFQIGFRTGSRSYSDEHVVRSIFIPVSRSSSHPRQSAIFRPPVSSLPANSCNIATTVDTAVVTALA